MATLFEGLINMCGFHANLQIGRTKRSTAKCVWHPLYTGQQTSPHGLGILVNRLLKAGFHVENCQKGQLEEAGF